MISICLDGASSAAKYYVPVRWEDDEARVACPFCGKTHTHRRANRRGDEHQSAPCGNGSYVLQTTARIDRATYALLCDYCEEGLACTIADGPEGWHTLCCQCIDARIANFNEWLATKKIYRDDDILCSGDFFGIANLRDDPLNVLQAYCGAPSLFAWLGEAGIEAVKNFNQSCSEDNKQNI
jgi:hypothetical protein